MAVREYISGEKTPSQIAKEYNICPYTIYTWRDQILGKKNMKTGKRQKNSPKLPDNVPELKEEVQKLTQEAEELRKQVFQLQLERDILEKAAEIIKKGVGISLEKLSNSEKAELIDALRKKYRLNTLLSSLHLSKSSYCYQVNVMKRPDKYQSMRRIIQIFLKNQKVHMGIAVFIWS